MPDERAQTGQHEPAEADADANTDAGVADASESHAATPDAATPADASPRSEDAQASAPDAGQPHASGDDPFAQDGPGEDDEEHAGADPDYYAVLGVSRNASAAEIRLAYHRLAKLWHPDRYMSSPAELRARAERRMRALVAAYDVLGDNARRQAYDGRFAPGGHGAWVDMEYTPPIWMGGTSRPPYGAPDPYPFAHMAKSGSPNGAGIFLGALAAMLALSVAIRSLGGGGNDAGTYIGFGLAALFGALAIWCLVAAEAAPVRLVRQWMEGDPAVHAAEQADSAAGLELEDTPDGASATSATTGDGGGAVKDEDEAEAGFERLVDEALASIPDEFQREMSNVVVRIKATPSADELARLEVGKHGLLLGLYEGVELTDQGAAGAGPEVITIFREPIERYCHGDPNRVRRQVRRTVLHEVAHHFGIDHEQMPDWIR